MATFDDFTDGIKKVFLAGVGAVAMGAEMSQDLVDDLIKKGELTVEQGKSLNEEIARKVKETADEAYDEVLRSKFRGMSVEERAAWIERAKRIAEDLEAEDAEFEVEEEAEAEADAEPEAEEEAEAAAEAEVEPEAEAPAEE